MSGFGFLHTHDLKGIKFTHSQFQELKSESLNIFISTVFHGHADTTSLSFETILQAARLH